MKKKPILTIKASALSQGIAGAGLLEWELVQFTCFCYWHSSFLCRSSTGKEKIRWSISNGWILPAANIGIPQITSLLFNTKPQQIAQRKCLWRNLNAPNYLCLLKFSDYDIIGFQKDLNLCSNHVRALLIKIILRRYYSITINIAKLIPKKYTILD